MAELNILKANILGSGIGDQPSDRDDLGFEPYVTAIAEFLTNEKTKGPLTMSVEGEWGTGKSSFMILLRDKLKKSGALTVNFNAWRHDKQDAVWAAFALKFVRDLSEKMSWGRRTKAKIRLTWHRYDWEEGWFRLLWLALSVMLFIILTVLLINHFWQTGFSQIAEIAKKEGDASLVTEIFLAGGVTGYIALSLYLIKKLKELLVNPLSTDLKRYLDKPDYQGHAAFIEDFTAGLAGDHVAVEASPCLALVPGLGAELPLKYRRDERIRVDLPMRMAQRHADFFAAVFEYVDVANVGQPAQLASAITPDLDQVTDVLDALFAQR